MKNLLSKSLLVLVAGLVLGSCGQKPTPEPTAEPSAQPTVEPTAEPSVQPTQQPTTEPTETPVDPTVEPTETPVDPTVEPTPDNRPVGEAGINLEDYKNYVLADLGNVMLSLGELDPATMAKVEAQANAGAEAILAGADHLAVMNAFNATKEAIVNEIPLANGVFSFVGKSNAEKTEILGILEAFAVRNGITGISLFEDGGYVMYHDRITLGTETYIPGYGFGTLAEGSINAPLTTEPNAAWQNYYHTWNVSDPGTANYLNDKGSEVSDFYSYIAASYFTTFMNETKDGYDWVPELANEKPVALNDMGGMATKWRFSVKTDEIKYTTNSQIESRKAFNNRPVEAEDYVTPYKLLLTQANGYARGAEMASATTGAIKGAAEYYEKTANGQDDALFEETVGIKCYEEGANTYFEYEFTSPVSQFYSMYYISSSLYMPIPQEFLTLVTPTNYLGFNAEKTETPLDNSLSLGAYALEAWNAGQEVVYKKNPNYVYADSKYKIEGVHINMLPAAEQDQEAGLKEFLAGNTDSSGIPQTQLEKYKNDPRTRKTTGSSNFKLNVNALSQEEWIKMFGVDGTVVQTPEEDYWVCEPALGNSHFVKALSLSIDRVTFADKRGSIASVDYLSSNYMSDPENGISYATTQAHKDAVATLLDQTDGYGYNLELARDYYKVALAELEAEGKYVPGTRDNPTRIELEIAWMYSTHEEAYHNEIEQFLETAFNHESVTGGAYELDVVFWVGNQWSDVYYNKMMLGQYDLGFGSISGNTLNPLDFVSVLSADQAISGGFTLNWGADTNDPAADALVYNGVRWSYDALWTAANAEAIVVDGVNHAAASFGLASHQENEDGTYTSVIDIQLASKDLVDIDVKDVVVFWADYEDVSEYFEESILASSVISEVDENGLLTITITSSSEIVAKYAGNMGFDVYYTLGINGGEHGDVKYSTSYAYFPTAE